MSSGLWQDDVWTRRICTGTEGAPPLSSVAEPSRLSPQPDRRQPFSPQQRVTGAQEEDATALLFTAVHQKNVVSNKLSRGESSLTNLFFDDNTAPVDVIISHLFITSMLL